MTDTRTVWFPLLGRADWRLAGSILEAGKDLETAVLVSLFTDRLAREDDLVPDGGDDPRGWWGDLAQRVPIGSRLWLLERSKLTPQIARQAEAYAREALQWLLDDEVVAAIEIRAEIEAPHRLGMLVDLMQHGNRKASLKYQWAWGQLS